MHHVKQLLLNHTFLLICLITLGALSHFIGLAWGQPYFFHPDERNIASSVAQLHYPTHMNPQFFAYGSLPIYAIYFLGLFTQLLTGTMSLQVGYVPFGEAILLSRFYSAFFATLLIPLIYFCGVKLKDKQTGLLAATLACASTGIIQFAHFGTFEMWLTFFSLVLFAFSLLFLRKSSLTNALAISACFGVLLATKITSLVMIPLIMVLFILGSLKQKTFTKKIIVLLGYLGLFLGVVCLLFIVTNPYVFIDKVDFLSSMKYESSVGLGTLPVFYTQGFYDTIPVVYQFAHVYPFLLNPLITLLLPLSLVILITYWIKKKTSAVFLLLTFFLTLFVTQSFFFIKWTRYLTPTLPFVYLCIALAYNTFYYKKSVRKLFIFIVLASAFIFGLSYFKTVFLAPDTRLISVDYAKKTITQSAKITSEMYDLGITAFNAQFPRITLFNTYDLDSHSPDYNLLTWQEALNGSDYIILPSQRVLQTRNENKTRFPLGYKVYAQLLDGTSGFTKIYQTPCDIFCQITYLGDPIYHLEQTASVFDHPTVMIFKKIQQ